MIVKPYVQETTKDSQLFRHTFLKSVLHLTQSPHPLEWQPLYTWKFCVERQGYK